MARHQVAPAAVRQGPLALSIHRLTCERIPPSLYHSAATSSAP